jgi:hypothetical protein
MMVESESQGTGNSIMLSAVNRVQSVTIVGRRSGPGYRLVLRRMTTRGTPVVETLDDSFDSVDNAARYAVDTLGIPADQVRTKLDASA